MRELISETRLQDELQDFIQEILDKKDEANKLLVDLWPEVEKLLALQINAFIANTDQAFDGYRQMVNIFRKAINQELLKKYGVDMMTARESTKYDALAEKLYDLAVENKKLPEILLFKKKINQPE